MKTCILLVSFGRDTDSMELHLSYTPYPVYVYKDMENKHEGIRSGYRNSNYWRIRKIMDLLEEFDQVCYLDNDMCVIDEGFWDGFRLAEKFGFCIPMNPRAFVGVDADKGVDANTTPEVYHGTAWNNAVIFASQKGLPFMKAILDENINRPQRGPMTMWEAAWHTGYVPYILPYQYCVCCPHLWIEKPLALHCGSVVVREYYKDLLKGKHEYKMFVC